MTGKKLKTSVIDNNERGSVKEFLTEKIKPDAELSFVSAYFTIYAYQHLKEKLDSIKRLDFLFGEPRFLKSLDPEKTDKKSFKIEDDGLKIENRLEQKKAAKECSEWMRTKVNIRSMIRPSFLHGKLYHIKNTIEVESALQHAIVGSSNFTVSGLGMGTNPNIELNLLINDKRDLDDLREWFLEVWNNTEIVEDVKDEVLDYLDKLYVDNSPEFIYYKTLYHLFEKYLGEQESSTILGERNQITESKIWKTLFEFQKDGVKGAINKINSHNGCIIADSVGLGKTFEALAIIKYFEDLNHKVLVLCPKKLKENWTIYQAQNNSELNLFLNDRFGYTVLCHTDLSRAGGKSGDIDLSAINWGNYDLVVIDESHNFRNNTKGKRDEDGKVVTKSRYERLMDDIIKSGLRTKVLLLSATPVNITLNDLRNQISFITEGKDDAFNKSMNIPSITNTLAVAQRNFTDWAKQKNMKERIVKNLLENLPSGFFKLLDELTIARSRKHIIRYYSKEMERIGTFPERLKPIAVFPKIDVKDEFMSYDKLNDEISNYQLSLFNPSKYIKNEYKAEYEEKTKIKGIAQFTQMKREDYLIGMMKINFLKRLESSIWSFKITMERTVKKIQELENKLMKFKDVKAANADIDNDELKVDDFEDDELHEALEVGKNFKYKLAHLKIEDWLTDLKKDKDQLSVLYKAAEKINVERDAKLLELKQRIEGKLMKPSTTKDGNPNRKVLIFTAFADTAEYLYGVISKWAHDGFKVHTAVVSGGTGSNKTTFVGYKEQTEFNNILTNFSPISKNRSKIRSMPQEGEIDILIATDCISEGQNLQDCDYLINYDIHWNPVKIIQRFGRIDRIGSINKTVQLVNYWVTEDLNKYINLKNRVEARMALVDITATTEDNILVTDDLKELITEDLRYRDKQLMRLKDEVLDLEDFNESASLSDFTLDEFRIELSNYIENNRQILKDAPLGLFTVVPSPSGENAHLGDYSKLDSVTKDIISKGVVFCLRQKGETDGTESVNPLQPYFLVFVRSDGTVRYTFTQPKQILEMYRIFMF